MAVVALAALVSGCVATASEDSGGDAGDAFEALLTTPAASSGGGTAGSDGELAPVARQASDSAPAASAPGPAANAPTETAVSGEAITLAVLLEFVEVAPESGHDSYDRDEWMADWGPGELDDGLNTRHEVLQAQSLCETVRTAAAVVEGCWFSVYDGEGTLRARDFDVDHVVALAEAHYSGGWVWSAAERTAFANGTANLIAVSAGSNRAKSADDPAEWMPPDTAVHCAYLVHWVAVKAGWGLSMDAAEHAAVSGRLADCGDTTADLFSVLADAGG